MSTLSILLVALAGFIGIVVAYLVSRKFTVSPKPAETAAKRKSIAELVAEGLRGAKPLPAPEPKPEFCYANRTRSGKRDKFRVTDMNRHYVFLDEIGRKGGAVMRRHRRNVQFV